MPCSRTQCSDAGEAQTYNPSVSSQALYHYDTAIPRTQRVIMDLYTLTLSILMAFPRHIDTVNAGLSIVYSKESQVEFSKILNVFLSLKIALI